MSKSRQVFFCGFTFWAEDNHPANSNSDSTESSQLGMQIQGYQPHLDDKAELDSTTKVATVEIQGRRGTQEDAYSSTLLDDDALVNANLSDEKIKRAYESAFNNTFNAIQAKYADHAQGSTVAIAIAQLDEHNIAHVALAHVGDTETFMVISNQHANVARHRRINKTLHHAGTNQAECRRVTKTGRKIYGDRVCGKLTLTRAVGDKGILNTFDACDDITKTIRTIQCNEDHQPEIQFFDIALEKKQTAYIVSACDGLCEQIDEGIKSSWVASSISTSVANHRHDSLDIARDLVKKSMREDFIAFGSHDNITVNILALEHGSPSNAPVAMLVCDGHRGNDVSNGVNQDFLPMFKEKLKQALLELVETPETKTSTSPRPGRA